jgi:hypothetical protein
MARAVQTLRVRATAQDVFASDCRTWPRSRWSDRVKDKGGGVAELRPAGYFFAWAKGAKTRLASSRVSLLPTSNQVPGTFQVCTGVRG